MHKVLSFLPYSHKKYWKVSKVGIAKKAHLQIEKFLQNQIRQIIACFTIYIPGITNLSVASMILAPEGTSRSSPTWAIFPSSTITSATSILSSLTTVPPLMRIAPDSWVKNGMAFLSAQSEKIWKLKKEPL